MNKIIFILFAQFIFSCASVKTQTVQLQPSKTSDCQIDVYTRTEDISRNFEKVCILTSKTGVHLLSKKTPSAAINRAKKEACECGADAIIVKSTYKKKASVLTYGRAGAVVEGIKYK